MARISALWSTWRRRALAVATIALITTAAEAGPDLVRHGWGADDWYLVPGALVLFGVLPFLADWYGDRREERAALRAGAAQAAVAGTAGRPAVPRKSRT